MTGNSEFRTPAETAAVLHTLGTPWRASLSQAEVVLLDDSQGRVSPEERRKIESVLQRPGERPRVLVTHIPPQRLPQPDRTWLAGRVHAGQVTLIVAAHSHRDSVESFAGVPCHTVRGLDPDKAIGGPPCVSLFEREPGGTWQRRDRVWDRGSGGWPPPRTRQFTELLGYSCMSQPIQGLKEAIARRVPAVELRARPAMEADRSRLAALVREWRECGGHTLSVHQTQLGWDHENGEVTGPREFRRTTDLALEIGADALTVHMPQVTVASIRSQDPARSQLLDMYTRLLGPAVEHRMTVSIENLHLTRDEPVDERRRYGYLPAECLEWIELLRRRLEYDGVGFHLDIGHARNNGIFASRYPLGTWYALLGPLITGYHIHQVVMREGRMANHFPFTGLYGPLISLCSFLWAWDSGQIAHAPMFLEVRGAGQSWRSWDHLRAELERTAPAGTV